MYLNGRINRGYYTQQRLYQMQVVYCLMFMAVMYKKNPHHTDHLGSSSIVTKSDGTIIERTEYTAWGEPWIQGGNIETLTDYRFTGKEQDYSKLYYFGARYYDPQVSLWMSSDPALNIFGVSYFMKSYNLSGYSYAANSPIKYTDPTGMYIEEDKVGTVTQASRDMKKFLRNIHDKDVTNVLLYLSERFGNSKSRYFKTGKGGYVDLKHFFYAAAQARKYPAGTVLSGGERVETIQALGGNISGWGTEDTVSNLLGIGFKIKNIESIVSDFNKYMQSAAGGHGFADDSIAEINKIHNFGYSPIMNSNDCSISYDGIRYKSSGNMDIDYMRLDQLRRGNTNPINLNLDDVMFQSESSVGK